MWADAASRPRIEQVQFVPSVAFTDIQDVDPAGDVEPSDALSANSKELIKRLEAIYTSENTVFWIFRQRIIAGEESGRERRSGSKNRYLFRVSLSPPSRHTNEPIEAYQDRVVQALEDIQADLDRLEDIDSEPQYLEAAQSYMASLNSVLAGFN
ncbi:MAG: hypothetical protein HETSPECPRED_002158 [Heterodermia speciosa]|uniref:Uncharacterized protein n=1 Tax=Heterodermia speciosa TaxID=116794 RepID=A0A8H3PFF0_9LECA|nr:MAG: hypothetical protein HETSPECPRED_002158 [Heterodermia speciosa]